MQRKRPHVPQSVVDIVKNWGTAATASEGVAALKRGRQLLDASERATLCREIAEISAETLVEVYAMENGVGEGKVETIDGIPLLPKQIERVSAWVNNQRPIADALGLEPDAWARLLNDGMAALIAGSPSPASSTSVNAAKKLLGGGAQVFENPSPRGQSDKAGLSGILAARAFQSPKK